MRRLSLTDARRLAVMGQLLGGPRPAGIVEVVEGLVRVQVDPTSIVERAERLTIWSRLGAYDREELRRLLEQKPRRLFEYNGFLLPVDDLPLYRSTMRRYPTDAYTRGRYVAEWLGDNADFRDYILGELRARGPLKSRDLDDRAEVPWQTGGWNDGKNLGRMLEIMWLRGDVAVARREGAERVWDLFERVLPATDADELPDEVVIIELMERRLRAMGLVQPGWIGALDLARLVGKELGEESLRLDGVAIPVEIDGVSGEWLAHRDVLARLDAGAWRARTTLLGPFDPLIHDRERTLALFGFRYAFELYKPAAKREYGPYTLAILHGERLVGRVDPSFDRRSRMLTLNSIHAEPEAPRDAWPAVRTAIDELAAWLGASDVDLPDLPPAWRAAPSRAPRNAPQRAPRGATSGRSPAPRTRPRPR
jgi:uncharacterized protein YcaQ